MSPLIIHKRLLIVKEDDARNRQEASSTKHKIVKSCKTHRD